MSDPTGAAPEPAHTEPAHTEPISPEHSTPEPAPPEPNILDDAESLAVSHPQILPRITTLPDQCREAWEAGTAWPIPDDLLGATRVVLFGVGGSGIGAAFIATLASQCGTVPMQHVPAYEAPPLGPDTLAIAFSHSGETEETLEAFQTALNAGARGLAITGGGRLGRLAGSLGYSVFEHDDPGPPKTAFGWGVFPALAILVRLGLLDLDPTEVTAAIDQLSHAAEHWGPASTEAGNAAKQIARRIHGRVPVIIGPGLLAIAAHRWAGEIQENGHQVAFYESLPEADHNLVSGFGRPAGAALHVLLLDAVPMHPRNRWRVQVTADALDRAGVPHDELLIGGDRAFDATLRACYLGDWTSFYLAVLNGVDPLPNEEIWAVKAALNEPVPPGRIPGA